MLHPIKDSAVNTITLHDIRGRILDIVSTALVVYGQNMLVVFVPNGFESQVAQWLEDFLPVSIECKVKPLGSSYDNLDGILCLKSDTPLNVELV